MNKIDDFFTIFSLWLVWVFMIYLLPTPVMMVIYMIISAIAIGMFIGRVPRILAKQTSNDEMRKMLGIIEGQNQTLEEMLQCLRLAEVANQSCAARIDALMFEFCPEDMTPEQIAKYEESVGQVSPDIAAQINRALH